MPRVHSQKRVAKGRERKCGRVGCGHVIEVGETYYRFKFRFGGEQYRCKDHYPRSSELTNSKMSQVYAANEDLDDQLDHLTSEDEIMDALMTVAEQAEEVASEYREADEAFGGYGATANAERADEVEEWQNELANFVPGTEVPDFDEDAEPPEDDEERAEYDRDRQEWEDALDALREEVRELLSGCSL